MAQSDTNTQLAQETSSSQPFDAVACMKQVEFYLGNENLPRDKFLFELVDGRNNKPVPLKIIHDFARMGQYQPFSAVVAAVRQSQDLDVNDEGEVSRKIPLGNNWTNDIAENNRIINNIQEKRAIWVKGMPTEWAVKEAQAEVESRFAAFEPTVVRIERDYLKNFTGCATVVFKDKRDQEKILKHEDEPGFFDVSYKDKTYTVKIMPKKVRDLEKSHENKKRARDNNDDGDHHNKKGRKYGKDRNQNNRYRPSHAARGNNIESGDGDNDGKLETVDAPATDGDHAAKNEGANGDEAKAEKETAGNDQGTAGNDQEDASIGAEAKVPEEKKV